MTVEPIVPDIAPVRPAENSGDSKFGEILNGLGTIFSRAEHSENAFANGSGNLIDAVYERAQADVALSVASAAAQRAAQALQTVLSIQV